MSGGRLGGALVVVLMGVAACSPSDPPAEPTAEPTAETTTAAPAESPSPTESSSPTPSPTPSPTEEELLAAEAITALEEYIALSAEVLNNAGVGWQRLMDWWGTPEMIDEWRPAYVYVEENGIYSEGMPRLVDFAIVEVITNPSGSGNEMVRIDLCTDGSNVMQFDRNGSVTERTLPSRRLTQYKLQRLGNDHWVVISEQYDSSRNC